MRRVLVRKPGGHSALELIDEPAPPARPGGVRVRVRACGVNFADCVVRMGHYEAAAELFPITPGFEFAGETEDGRRVLGVTRFGGYASELVVDPMQLWDIPPGWSFEQAAGFPAVHMTAWWGLHETARVRAGESILVHSAAGGAGSAFVELGKLAGCKVTGVVGSQAKRAACKADRVLLRSELWPEGERWDAIFDANGVHTVREGWERLTVGGRLVVYGFADLLPRGAQKLSWPHAALNWLKLPRFNPLHMTGRNRGVLGFNVVYMFDKLDVAQRAMKEMLAKLPPPPVTAYPLEDVARAHADLESGKTTGKLVLLP